VAGKVAGGKRARGSIDRLVPRLNLAPWTVLRDLATIKKRRRTFSIGWQAQKAMGMHADRIADLLARSLRRAAAHRGEGEVTRRYRRYVSFRL